MEAVKEVAPKYWQRFRKLLLKWWLIIFLARAILISIAGFGSNLLIFMALGPITMWIGIFAMVATPEFDIAVKLFRETAFAYWLIIPFTLFLIAVTSSILVALVVSIAACENRNSN